MSMVWRLSFKNPLLGLAEVEWGGGISPKIIGFELCHKSYIGLCKVQGTAYRGPTIPPGAGAPRSCRRPSTADGKKSGVEWVFVPYAFDGKWNSKIGQNFGA